MYINILLGDGDLSSPLPPSRARDELPDKPTTPVMPVEECDSGGRRTRLAALAKNINTWEEDLHSSAPLNRDLKYVKETSSPKAARVSARILAAKNSCSPHKSDVSKSPAKKTSTLNDVKLKKITSISQISTSNLSEICLEKIDSNPESSPVNIRSKNLEKVNSVSEISTTIIHEDIQNDKSNKISSLASKFQIPESETGSSKEMGTKKLNWDQKIMSSLVSV